MSAAPDASAARGLDASSAGNERVYRRVLRRETSASRSGTVVVAMLLTVLLAAAVVFAAAVVLLGQRVAGVDPEPSSTRPCGHRTASTRPWW